MEEVGGLLKAIVEKLTATYGEKNWKIRRVSRARRDAKIPSLTITEELEAIGCNIGDYVVVAVQGDAVVIRKI